MTGEKETICPVEDTQPAPSKPRPWHWMARSWLLATNTVISTGPKRDCPGLLIIYVHISLHLVAYSSDSRPSGLGPAVGHGLFATRQQNIWKSSILSALCTTYKYNFIGRVTKNIAKTLKSCTQSWGPSYNNITQINVIVSPTKTYQKESYWMNQLNLAADVIRSCQHFAFC